MPSNKRLNGRHAHNFSVEERTRRTRRNERRRFLSRALEPYTGKPRSAAEDLEFVKQQTGRTPKLLKSPLEVFRAGYKEEGLI
ncbi:MAG: hypothetical protein C5S38_02560 [Candidatus Methanophagaceae archaeon]|nr:MAG: hypothetical protein C5S38_02560 [Methanophagales archaeon]KAF5434591.1 hypothetical protein C5S36_04765 [Methanophagales archaeon]